MKNPYLIARQLLAFLKDELQEGRAGRSSPDDSRGERVDRAGGRIEG